MCVTGGWNFNRSTCSASSRAAAMSCELILLTSPVVRHPSQVFMAAIAERHGAGMFTGAPGHRFGFLDLHLLGDERRAFVRAVAERLRFRPSAGAPIVSAGIHLLDDGRFLRDGWFHGARVMVSHEKVNGWFMPEVAVFKMFTVQLVVSHELLVKKL